MALNHNSLQQFFLCVNQNIETRVKKKLRDSNVLKSNACNPHHKKILINDVPKLSFAVLFGKKFVPGEPLEVPKIGSIDKRSFAIKSLRRVSELFSDDKCLVKHLRFHDKLLVCPWVSFKQETQLQVYKLVDGELLAAEMISFEGGRLAIPVKKVEGENKVKVFVPCGGLDENDEVPQWASSFSLMSDFGLDLPITHFNFEPGVGTITVEKGTRLDIGYISKHQDVNDGDIFKIRNNFYTVLGCSIDTFNSNLKCVRFTTDIERNAFCAPYSIFVNPVVRGNFFILESSILQDHRPFEISHGKCNPDMHGPLTITYQNACFNSLGFLTHDVGI